MIAKPEAAVSIRQGLEARAVLAELRVSQSDDVDEALALVRADTDVVVACGGGTSSESLDRPDLKLDQHDFLLELARRLQRPGGTDAAAAAPPRPRLVVLALAPGTVLTPLTLTSTLTLALTLNLNFTLSLSPSLSLSLTLTLTLTRC